MPADDINNALTQIREVKQRIVEQRDFKGYSGVAKLIGSGITLVGAILISSGVIARTEQAILTVWLVIGFGAAVLYYAAVVRWFVGYYREKRSWDGILPVIDASPVFAVMMVLTVVLIRNDLCVMLFGMWLSLYGLTHVVYRKQLPIMIYYTGIFYIICGSVLLLHPVSFLNPWPFTIVIMIGEVVSGLTLYSKQKRTRHTDEKEKLL